MEKYTVTIREIIEDVRIIFVRVGERGIELMALTYLF
jgi:hypothetical protein